jgi:phosphoribosylglycinamide formyltransferase-1
MTKEKLRLGCLASHNGSSMQAIHFAIKNEDLAAEICTVISNNAGSQALTFAQENNIPSKYLSIKTEGSLEDLDRAILNELQDKAVNLVILSGWMLFLGPQTISRYEGRILNSHPALFSSPYKGKGFYGDKVHKAVLDAGEQTTGVTIHLVDAVYDHGQTLAEQIVEVKQDDTVESLRERVKKQEQQLYILVIKKILAGEIELG